VRSGDLFICEGPAGGGYGPPKRREPERVAEDVADGLISALTAQERFGVVLTETGAVDRAATEALRRS